MPGLPSSEALTTPVWKLSLPPACITRQWTGCSPAVPLPHRTLPFTAPPCLRAKSCALPVVIGESQPGNNCSLSAHSGLPALSLPMGFTSEGLPLGIELLGAAFSDARLLALGYEFEQHTEYRRPPASTPSLLRLER